MRFQAVLFCLVFLVTSLIKCIQVGQISFQRTLYKDWKKEKNYPERARLPRIQATEVFKPSHRPYLRLFPKTFLNPSKWSIYFLNKAINCWQSKTAVIIYAFIMPGWWMAGLPSIQFPFSHPSFFPSLLPSFINQSWFCLEFWQLFVIDAGHLNIFLLSL